ncbi:U3 small nucleolar RNA-associated protein 18 homolog [Leguminivora glycinivorella]|uniref:U3 small nucleolar RNA-associated protein 18 homolog n=1 Tax=Leguminivora glycinivorella TaxID=1035111 RepID=UPI00200C961C|nr:U3 small nucleolar RNA-associated protein 18 homolog [Leguminivora glycinivorella]
MKRNWSKPRGKSQMKKIRSNDEDPEEAKLSQLLFHKSKNMSEKLKSQDVESSELDLKPAWVDDDDQNQVASNPLFKGKSQYADKLKQKFETMMGTPSWAKIKPKTGDEDEFSNRVGHLESRKKLQAGTGLKAKILEIKPAQDANADTKNEGRNITCVEFHPKLSVTLVGGSAGVVSLLSLSGHENKKLHSFSLKKWEIQTARFTPSGTHAFITSSGRHRQYCYYDLVKAVPEMIDLPNIVNKANNFELSRDGKYIAICGGFDEVLILSATSKELIRRLKNNSNIVSICFSDSSEQLYCYGAQGEVTMWDLYTFRSYRKFYDQGCVNGSIITASPCGRLLALGSGEGIVNVYKTSELKESTTYNPEPFHVVSSLCTKITGLQFNASTEILGIISNVLPSAAKLVHIPSYKIFQNYPTQGKDIGILNCIGFSPNSGYMGVGNDKGHALLYRLRHYTNY